MGHLTTDRKIRKMCSTFSLFKNSLKIVFGKSDRNFSLFGRLSRHENYLFQRRNPNFVNFRMWFDANGPNNKCPLRLNLATPLYKKTKITKWQDGQNVSWNNFWQNIYWNRKTFFCSNECLREFTVLMRCQVEAPKQVISE